MPPLFRLNRFRQNAKINGSMKNIIITGASRGIGYDAAILLARQGHRVLALSRNEESLKALKAEAG
ncbi:MAG: SDR family NAD(P)-dependent oxidoreductase, partial [Phaeodactylibacter sp.]|nr:SDR family NAD(P)-dependent oxidoreductase [Phaeodactylibacter sp.]